MIDGPTWPGDGEYLYQAASLLSGRSLSGGTWMVPSGLSPTSMSLDRTLMAGIEMSTGGELAVSRSCIPEPFCAGDAEPRSVACAGLLPSPDGAGMAPACAGPGCGGWCWAATATPSTLPPPVISATPAPSTAIRRFDQAVMAGPHEVRPSLPVDCAGSRPTARGQADDSDAGQGEGTARAEQGGILEADQAAAARGRGTLGHAYRRSQAAKLRIDLSLVEVAGRHFRLKFGDIGLGGAARGW